MKKMKNARKDENKAISNSFSPSSTPIITYSILGSVNLIENVRSNRINYFDEGIDRKNAELG
jgi:hypothetical protein